MSKLFDDIKTASNIFDFPSGERVNTFDRSYGDEVIQQRKRDGYVNATALCKAAGKRINDYLRLNTTEEFLEELSSVAGIPATEIVQIIQGGSPSLQGTWVHPYVAINLGQWLSPKFAVLVSKWVHDWMTFGLSPAESTAPQDQAVKAMETVSREALAGNERIISKVLGLVEQVLQAQVPKTVEAKLRVLKPYHNFLNATKIGERLGCSPIEANRLLEDNGFHYRNGTRWELTEKCRMYAVSVPGEVKGKVYFSNVWSPLVIAKLKGRVSSTTQRKQFDSSQLWK